MIREIQIDIHRKSLYACIYIYIADVTEWSRTLDIKLSDWCCSVLMVWIQILYRENKNNCNLKNLILTLLGLIFRCIYFMIMFWLIIRNDWWYFCLAMRSDWSYLWSIKRIDWSYFFPIISNDWSYVSIKHMYWLILRF